MRPTLKDVRTDSLSGAAPASRAGRPAARVIARPQDRDDMADRLGSLPDRADLERLFDRHVEVPKLLRLMARQVSRQQIQELLDSKDFEQDLEKLLA